MAIDLHAYNSWLGGEKIEGAKFIHNTYVEVIGGEHKGATGSVVSLVRLGSDARYVVEKESGFDIEVAESEIAEKNSKQVAQVPLSKALWLKRVRCSKL